MICPGDPHQRNTNAPKFEDRSEEETEWQEQGAREAAWRPAKSILKLKEKNKSNILLTFGRLVPACANFQTWGTRICCRPRSVDAYDQQKRTWILLKWILWRRREVLRQSQQPMEKCRRMKRPQLMSKYWISSWQWKSSRIRQQFYRSESFAMNTDTLMNGSTVKNHTSLKNGIRIQCNTENFVPIVVPGLSTSSSSSFPLQHPWHLQGRRLIILRLPQARLPHHTHDIFNCVKRQCDLKSRGRPVWDAFLSSNCVKWTCWKERTERPVFFWNPRRAAVD